jgi:hypothetical protein
MPMSECPASQANPLPPANPATAIQLRRDTSIPSATAAEHFGSSDSFAARGSQYETRASTNVVVASKTGELVRPLVITRPSISTAS